jgi:hypothetical protein
VKVFSYDDRFEWTENRTFYASGESGLDWATNPVWSFDRDNYPCPSCTPGNTLAARIAALDKTTVFNTSKNLARMMIAWLKVGAAPLPSRRMYMMSLDATCEAPDKASRSNGPSLGRP